MSSKLISEIFKSAAGYWWAEYCIVWNYLESNLRDGESEKRWLGYQMFKEWTGSGVYGGEGVNVLELLEDCVQEIRISAEKASVQELNKYLRQLSFASDELKHYRDLKAAYELAGGVRVGEFSSLGNLVEGLKLTQLRNEYRAGSQLGVMAVELSEGGGLGMYFAIRNFYSGKEMSELETKIFGVGKNTLADEIGHMKNRIDDLTNAHYSTVELESLNKYLCEILEQKMLERNEQFSSQFSKKELGSLVVNSEQSSNFVKRHLKFVPI